MTAESRASIINKLNKLKAFIERDCGNESINAQRIADNLIKKYGITPSEFHYVHFSAKQAQDAQRAEAEARFYQAQADQRAKAEREAHERCERSRSATFNDVTISHIDSKKITIALLNKMNLKYTIKGWKIKVECSAKDYVLFSYRLDQIKEIWRRGLDAVNQSIIDRLNTI